MQPTSVLRCPHCGAEHTEQMPVDACRFFYECGACGRLLRSRAGDCCVFCSYGSVPCPPVQSRESRCGTPVEPAGAPPG